jgi:predicted RNase H-like HicB family nuclease
MASMQETRIAVRLRYNEQTGTWHFRVADPIVVGGGQRTAEEALQAAAEAIAFSLEDDPEPDQGEGRVEYLRVAVG